jgi:beta-lactamase superfamily II metal-dependent hydrolase
MYNVGFGDSFLLTFPAPDRPRKVLVDCGVHPSGPGPRRMAEVVDRIVADVTEDGTPRIDLVIATHRHADHVSGFQSRSWDQVEVGEVWMPWTEHPTDPEARRIREKQSRVAKHLASNRAIAAAARSLAENNLTNAAAMATLHRGFSGAPVRRFLPELDADGKEIRKIRPALLAGVDVHVLGPSRDADIIRDMDPPEGESYLRLAAMRERIAADGDAGPFRARWTIPRSDFQRLTGRALTASEVRELAALEEEDAFAVATSLEKAVNGTSLMLQFEIGGAHLLFPGDAQWGTWKRVLDDPSARDLLERTNFLKVGHHGSHNATPRDFVRDVLSADFLGFVSTRANTKNWDIPRGPLLEALRDKPGRIARSDRRTPKESVDFRRTKNEIVEVDVPI